MEGGTVGHNCERNPPKDHPCQVWFNLVQRFQRKRFKYDTLTVKLFSLSSCFFWLSCIDFKIFKSSLFSALPVLFSWIFYLELVLLVLGVVFTLDELFFPFFLLKDSISSSTRLRKSSSQLVLVFLERTSSSFVFSLLVCQGLTILSPILSSWYYSKPVFSACFRQMS